MHELRPLHKTVTMDDLEDLDTVKADPLYDALDDADIGPQKRDEVINRLLNAKAEAAGITHAAKVLARSNSYLKGSSITFRHHRDGAINGVLGQAYESGAGDVAIEINGEFRVVAGNILVKVFPKKKGPELLCGSLVGTHLAYGQLICDQPLRHSTAHQQSKLPEQCEKTRSGIRCAYNKGHNNPLGHNFSKHLNKLRGQHPLEEWTSYQAEFLWMNRDRFLGREIQLYSLTDEAPRGTVTDIWHITTAVGTRIFLVFDGKIHSVPITSKVEVAPLKSAQCSTIWSGDGDPSQCTLNAGHIGSHQH